MIITPILWMLALDTRPAIIPAHLARRGQSGYYTLENGAWRWPRDPRPVKIDATGTVFIETHYDWKQVRLVRPNETNLPIFLRTPDDPLSYNDDINGPEAKVSADKYEAQEAFDKKHPVQPSELPYDGKWTKPFHIKHPGANFEDKKLLELIRRRQVWASAHWDFNKIAMSVGGESESWVIQADGTVGQINVDRVKTVEVDYPDGSTESWTGLRPEAELDEMYKEPYTDARERKIAARWPQGY